MGNFVLSLADHAQNGFFQPTEWVGVVARRRRGRLPDAVVVVPDSRSLLAMNLVLMVVQVVVGLLGFYLHTRANWNRRTGSLWDTFVYGAPIFAPLLFADLAFWPCWACGRRLDAWRSDGKQLSRTCPRPLIRVRRLDRQAVSEVIGLRPRSSREL